MSSSLMITQNNDPHAQPIANMWIDFLVDMYINDDANSKSRRTTIENIINSTIILYPQRIVLQLL